MDQTLHKLFVEVSNFRDTLQPLSRHADAPWSIVWETVLTKGRIVLTKSLEARTR